MPAVLELTFFQVGDEDFFARFDRSAGHQSQRRIIVGEKDFGVGMATVIA